MTYLTHTDKLYVDSQLLHLKFDASPLNDQKGIRQNYRTLNAQHAYFNSYCFYCIYIKTSRYKALEYEKQRKLAYSMYITSLNIQLNIPNTLSIPYSFKYKRRNQWRLSWPNQFSLNYEIRTGYAGPDHSAYPYVQRA